MSFTSGLLFTALSPYRTKFFTFSSPSPLSRTLPASSHLQYHPFVNLRCKSTKARSGSPKKPANPSGMTKNTFQDQDDEIQLKRQTEFPPPEGVQQFLQSEENRELRQTLNTILKQSKRQIAPVTFGVINSKLSKLYPKQVRKWIEYAKTPRGFYDTAGEWTAGVDNFKVDNKVDFFKEEEDRVEASAEQIDLGSIPQHWESNGLKRDEITNDLESLERLLEQLDVPTVKDLDPDFTETLEQETRNVFESENILKALEEFWLDEGKEEPTIIIDEERERERKRKESFVLSMKNDFLDSTFMGLPKDVRDTLTSVSENPENLDDRTELGKPRLLANIVPNVDTDTQAELESKTLSLAQYEERYGWHLRRAELLRERIRLKEQFQLPLPDDLQGGYRFNVTERELNEYNVPPKLREFLSIRWGTTKEKRQYRIRKWFERHRRHFADTGSPELTVFALTVRIVSLRQILLLTPRDTNNARALEILVNRRKAFLKYLKRTNQKTYFKVLNSIPLADSVRWTASPRSTL